MGHRRDAVEALREYAHDLEFTTYPGGVTYRVGSSPQGDERRVDHDLGAPQLRVLVASVAVALVGLVGVAGIASAAAPVASKAASATDADPVSRDLVATGAPAVRALAKMGDTNAAALVASALAHGEEADASAEAIARIEVLAAAIANGHARPGDTGALAAAVEALSETLVPPMAQDDDFTPPGQDDSFTPPGQDDDFTPPGRAVTP
jgi:hypothetical protein